MRQRPSFFIAGNSKSGTSALHRFLQAHPRVFMCSPKEPDFFCRDLNRDPVPGRHFHQQSLEEYLSLFDAAEPGQLCGEASAVYLYSEAAAREIHAFCPEARIVVMLREPVDFLYSYHQQLLKNPPSDGEDVKDFEQALALESERRAGRALPPQCRVPELLYYRARVDYAAQLERYYALFPPEQILVLLYDDFRRDNAAVYRQVLAFLGVDATFEPAFAIHNRGANLRSKRLQRFAHSLTRGDGWAAPVKAVATRLVPTALRRRAVERFYEHVVFKPRQAPRAEFARALRREFKPHVERLSALLDRDVVRLWGYDEAVEAARA